MIGIQANQHHNNSIVLHEDDDADSGVSTVIPLTIRLAWPNGR